MLTRRQLLIGSVLGGLGAGLLARGAWAFSVETTPRFAADAFALACKPAVAGGGDHGALIAAVQSILKGKIADGAAPANVEQVVVCPICGCRIIVTADASY